MRCGRVRHVLHHPLLPSRQLSRTLHGSQLRSHVQEVTLPDGSSFRIFDMCAVKIRVDTKENHRESLRIELIDRSMVSKTDLVA